MKAAKRRPRWPERDLVETRAVVAAVASLGCAMIGFGTMKTVQVALRDISAAMAASDAFAFWNQE